MCTVWTLRIISRRNVKKTSLKLYSLPSVHYAHSLLCVWMFEVYSKHVESPSSSYFILGSSYSETFVPMSCNDPPSEVLIFSKKHRENLWKRKLYFYLAFSAIQLIHNSDIRKQNIPCFKFETNIFNWTVSLKFRLFSWHFRKHWTHLRG